MSETRLPRSIFLAIVTIAVAQAIYNFPLLPETVASHFSASGIANGWMPKQAFFVIYAIMVLVACVVQFFVPFSIANVPNARVNLPHKDYWLAPAQRENTMAYFKKSFAWFACALLLLEVLAMGLAIQANFNSPPQVPAIAMLSLVVAFLLYTIVWVILMVRHFSTVPPTL